MIPGHIQSQPLGFVSDVKGNIKITGNYAHIFVSPAQISSDN